MSDGEALKALLLANAADDDDVAELLAELAEANPGLYFELVFSTLPEEKKITIRDRTGELTPKRLTALLDQHQAAAGT